MLRLGFLQMSEGKILCISGILVLPGIPWLNLETLVARVALFISLFFIPGPFPQKYRFNKNVKLISDLFSGYLLGLNIYDQH